jgi:hypothetical protein
VSAALRGARDYDSIRAINGTRGGYPVIRIHPKNHPFFELCRPAHPPLLQSRKD